MTGALPPRRAAAIAAAVERWFADPRNVRPLPWRPGPRRLRRDPWAALVSEIMLQQTQASRVAERFPGFLAQFPDPCALAEADEDTVLGAWQGMGYYRRARALHAAARAIVERHGGSTPRDVESLRALPGVGAYTAGAVASIACGVRTPIVDANIARIVLRLDASESPIGSREADRLAWEHAGALVGRAESPGALNEGLMELGATVCLPRSPRCGACPLARLCRAHRTGMQGSIPVRPEKKPRRIERHAAVVVRNAAGEVLLERRPPGGLWGGMWQVITVERPDRLATARELASSFGLRRVRTAGGFSVTTTASRVEFGVFTAESGAAHAKARPGAAWTPVETLAALPLAAPHRRAIEMVAPREKPARTRRKAGSSPDCR